MSNLRLIARTSLDQIITSPSNKNHCMGTATGALELVDTGVISAGRYELAYHRIHR